MFEFLPNSVARTARIAVSVGALSLSVGCSGEVTRLSQPFFDFPEVTGSVTPIPDKNVAPSAASAAPSGPPPASSRRVASNAPAALNGSGGIEARPIERRAVPQVADNNGFRTVRTERGDSVYSLSRRYGVSARAIMAANRWQQPDDLRPGQNVLIPPVSWRPESQFSVGAVEPPPPAPKRIHVVRRGETLYAIARENGVSARDLVRHNRLASADKLSVGQRLEIPGSAPVQVASAENFATDAGGPMRLSQPSPTPRPDRRQSSSLDPLPAPASKTVAAPLPAPRPKFTPKRVASLPPKQQPKETSTGSLPEPRAMSVGQFRWPVRGRVISQFGSHPNGSKNDGINIAVPEGTPVKATESGVVAYVGNELKGYGNLVLIRHSGDWVSAYAHNSQTLVTRGEQVRRGQVIAKAGQSGNVTQPQLHFELRKGSRPVDPLGHLDSAG